jgi:hypothetical protein
MSELAQALVIYGPLGIICVGLAYACASLQKQLADAQAARVEDAKKVSETLLAVADENNRVLNDLTRAVESWVGRRMANGVNEQRPINALAIDRVDPRKL